MLYTKGGVAWVVPLKGTTISYYILSNFEDLSESIRYNNDSLAGQTIYPPDFDDL